MCALMYAVLSHLTHHAHMFWSNVACLLALLHHSGFEPAGTLGLSVTVASYFCGFFHGSLVSFHSPKHAKKVNWLLN